MPDVSTDTPAHHVHVALSDEHHSAENDPAHSLADLAAGLAANLVERREFRGALEELAGAIETLVPPPHQLKASDALGALTFASTDAARAGARLGFALARVESAMHLGWDTWLSAAVEELARSGCSIESHLAVAIEHLTSDRQRIR